MDHYFDLHFHPVSKNHLGNYPEKKPKPLGLSASEKENTKEKKEVAENKNSSQTNKKGDNSNSPAIVETALFTRKIKMSKGFMDFMDEIVLRILESQSSIEQLIKGKVSLGVAAISALEFGVASSKGFLCDVMKNGFANPFDQEYFEVVREGKVSYLNLFLKEVERYVQLNNQGSFNFLQLKKPIELGKNYPNLVLGIEGGHNLSTKKIGNALEYDTFEEFDVNSLFYIEKAPKTPQDVLKWLVHTLGKHNIDVLYLTLTHLTHIPEQYLATHAFGTKMLMHPSFYPFGSGLSELGKKVVDQAYGLENSQKSDLIIDIKHMSLKSRQDLYEYRKPKKDREKVYEEIPLIASHVGVTGYSVNDWKENVSADHCSNHVDMGIKTIKIKASPKVAGYWGSGNTTEFNFNPNTINLMDEDIIEIVKSNGLIGVGLDVRLLGSDSSISEPDNAPYEFLSTAEFAHHFPYTGIKSLNFTDSDEIKSEEKFLKPTQKRLHPLSLCFNIVHVMAVVKLKTKMGNDKDFYKNISIGSDFDGFIEPIKICGSSEYMGELEANLLKWLPVAAKRYQEENGGADDLFEFAKKKAELKEIVEAILYENGRNFLKQQGYINDEESRKATPPTKKAEAKR